jgi:hypothetical protein
MIISHLHRFIFIKNAKTAGTSLEVFLAGHCGPDDIVTPIFPAVAGHVPRNHTGYWNHMLGAEIRAQVGAAVWLNYFTFCVERNPWDKVISHWPIERHRAGGNLTLAQYILAGRFPINHPKYTEPADPLRTIVKRILRFEDLNHEIDEVAQQLGIPFAGTLEPQAKAEYRTDRRPYREILDQKYRRGQTRLIICPEGVRARTPTFLSFPQLAAL